MRVRYSALLLLLCCAWPSAAGAGIPSPMNCTFPYLLPSCPAGDVQFEVVVRDIGNWAVVGSHVMLTFPACPGVVFCDDCCPGLTFDQQARTVTAVTDANGVAAFSLKMGGLCPTDYVEVRADGYFLGSATVGLSTDRDGNLQVDATDAAMVRALIGSADWSADLDGDGEVTEADVSWLTDLHGGHSCAGVVPTRTTTWGSVKLLYR
jgi:hypothetical protein